MPESRKRKKKPKSRGRSGVRPAAAAMAVSPPTGPRLDPQIRAAAAAAPAITRAHVPTAIGKLVAAVPGLDAVIREDLGIPPNVCVEACRWLHYAYAQLGIRSVLSAAGLVVSGPAGNAILKAPVSPSWTGAVLDRHAILCLPEVRRFVDPTVEQYPEVAQYRIGPVSGLALGQLGGSVRPAPFVPGDQLIVRRKDLTLVYTLGDPAGTREIMGHWAVQDRTEVHRGPGSTWRPSPLISCADSLTCARLRSPGCRPCSRQPVTTRCGTIPVPATGSLTCPAGSCASMSFRCRPAPPARRRRTQAKGAKIPARKHPRPRVVRPPDHAAAPQGLRAHPGMGRTGRLDPAACPAGGVCRRAGGSPLRRAGGSTIRSSRRSRTGPPGPR